MPASIRTRQRKHSRAEAGPAAIRRLSVRSLLLSVPTAVLLAWTAWAEAAPGCRPVGRVLWGDGRHDDTAALNAWFRGERVAWAETGASVGAVIAGRTFLLSTALYAPSGSGRSLEQFRLLWPARHETVAGATIRTGSDRNRAPIMLGITKTGGDSGEGVPFAGPDPAPRDDGAAACPIS